MKHRSQTIIASGLINWIFLVLFTTLCLMGLRSLNADQKIATKTQQKATPVVSPSAQETESIENIDVEFKDVKPLWKRALRLCKALAKRLKDPNVAGPICVEKVKKMDGIKSVKFEDGHYISIQFTDKAEADLTILIEDPRLKMRLM